MDRPCSAMASCIDFFSAASIPVCPKLVRAPERDLLVANGTPLESQRNSTHKSKIRVGIGQPNTSWQPSSALARYATNRLSGPIEYGGRAPNSSHHNRSL